MCLILFAWQAHPDFPLVLAANRDEFHARPARALCWWPESDFMLAGRDDQAGGTWLGVTRSGRFAAITNHRAPTERDPTKASRGGLVSGFLAADTAPGAYLHDVARDADTYNGFNLLAGVVGGELWYMSKSERTPRPLSPGVYGLSNDQLDTPWPKLLRARHTLAEALPLLPSETLLWDILTDESRPPDALLPDTGIGIEMERFLAPAFIRGETYGTRASTVLCASVRGNAYMEERSWGPHGRPQGVSRHAFRVPGIRME